MDSSNWRRLMTAIKAGLRGIRSAPVVFMTSVVTMTAGMLLLAGYLLLVMNMRGTLGRLGDELSVYAYLPTQVDPNPEQVLALQERFLAFTDVSESVFVSRDEAMEQLKGDLGDLSQVLAGLEANPLPASFEIRLAEKARDPERVRVLAAQIQAIEGIEETRYGEEWVGVYARVLRTAELTGMGLGIGLFLVLSVIVGGTVRLAVYVRADEIEIQRLVGAGGVYVRLPFFIQGVLQGGMGAGFAVLLLYGLFRLDLPMLGAPLQLLTGATDIVFFGPVGVGVLIATGIGLGLSGAVLWLFRLEEA